MSVSYNKVTFIIENDDVRSIIMIPRCKGVEFHEKYMEPVGLSAPHGELPMEFFNISIDQPQKDRETGQYYTGIQQDLRYEGEEKIYEQLYELIYTPFKNPHIPHSVLVCESCGDRILIWDMKKHNDLHEAHFSKIDWSEINE